jgi:hypothetical protein
VRELSESYSLLATEVQRIREARSQKFAELLADWTQAGSRSPDVLPVENMLDEIVGRWWWPEHVLLIVIDGMSVAVCRELLSDLEQVMAGYRWWNRVVGSIGRDWR